MYAPQRMTAILVCRLADLPEGFDEFRGCFGLAGFRRLDVGRIGNGIRGVRGTVIEFFPDFIDFDSMGEQ